VVRADPAAAYRADSGDGGIYAGWPVPGTPDTAVLAGLDAATGARRWTSHLSTVPGYLTVTDGVIVGGTPLGSIEANGSSTFAVDTLTGRLLWQTRNIGVSGTAAEEGIAYLAGISAQALDARSGRQLWTRSYASPASFVAAASGVVYLDCYPHLVAASAATGAQLWSYSQGTANSNLFTMAAGNGVVYVANSGQASGTVDAVRM